MINSVISPNIVNLYEQDAVEVISYGSLFGNITIEDVLSGISTSRNPLLQSLFIRLNMVEAIGSGLRRIKDFYDSRNIKGFEIRALPSSFIVTLPKIEFEEAFHSGELDSESAAQARLA